MYRTRTSYRLVGAASLLALGAACALPASAQAAGPIDTIAAAEDVAESNDRVIVTGARGVTRTVDDSVSPIDVLSADSVESATKANLQIGIIERGPRLGRVWPMAPVRRSISSTYRPVGRRRGTGLEPSFEG